MSARVSTVTKAIRRAREHMLKANSWLGEAQAQEWLKSQDVPGLRALRDMVTSLDNMAGVVEFHSKHPGKTTKPSRS